MKQMKMSLAELRERLADIEKRSGGKPGDPSPEASEHRRTNDVLAQWLRAYIVKQIKERDELH